MQLSVAYRHRSTIRQSTTGLAVSLAPNLRRDRVSFNGVLKQPLRFREAVSALHDVVVSDLRFQPKDKSAYEAYLKEAKKREEMIRRAAKEFTRDKALAEFPEPRRKEIQEKYRSLHKLYWDARQRYSTFLQEHDPDLFRLVM